MDIKRLKAGLRDITSGSVLMLLGAVPIALVFGVAVGIGWRVASYIILF